MKNNKQHSTHYIHRISYSAQERMVGVFVLSAIAVLVFLILSTIKSQNIFEESFVIYGKLKSAEGLSTETIVQVSGIEVGKVSELNITDDNHIMLTMHIYNRFNKLLRTDSIIGVSGLSATIFGKSIIEITAGSHDKKMLVAGTVLDIQQASSIKDIIAEASLMLDTVDQLVSSVVHILDSDKIEKMMDSFNQMTEGVNQLTGRINSGKGTMGALFYDEGMKNNIHQSMQNINQATLDMKDLLKLLKNDAKNVPELIRNINKVIDETEKTIQATQKIWPISSSIKNNKSTETLLSPLPAND